MRMLMRHALIRRLMGPGVGMRMIVHGFTMFMLMGVDDDLAAAAAGDTVLTTDFADSLTFGTHFHIFHLILLSGRLIGPGRDLCFSFA